MDDQQVEELADAVFEFFFGVQPNRVLGQPMLLNEIDQILFNQA